MLYVILGHTLMLVSQWLLIYVNKSKVSGFFGALQEKTHELRFDGKLTNIVPSQGLPKQATLVMISSQSGRRKFSGI